MTSREILSRIKLVLGIKTDTDLSELFEIPRPTLQAWLDKNIIDLYRIAPKILENGISIDWLLDDKADIQFFKDNFSKNTRYFPKGTEFNILDKKAVKYFVEIEQGKSERLEKEINLLKSENERLKIENELLMKLVSNKLSSSNE